MLYQIFGCAWAHTSQFVPFVQGAGSGFTYDALRFGLSNHHLTDKSVCLCNLHDFSCDWELFTREELLWALIFLSKFGMHE